MALRGATDAIDERAPANIETIRPDGGFTSNTGQIPTVKT
jgi:hypothetical protein